MIVVLRGCDDEIVRALRNEVALRMPTIAGEHIAVLLASTLSGGRYRTSLKYLTEMGYICTYMLSKLSYWSISYPRLASSCPYCISLTT